METKDWRIACLDRMSEVFEISDSDVEELVGGEGWEENSFREFYRLLFPDLDLEALQNGISTTQLGTLMGQQRALLDLFAPIADNVEVSSEIVSAIASSLLNQLEFDHEHEGAEEEVSTQLEAMPGVFEELNGVIQEVVSLVPSAIEAMSDCFTIVNQQSTKEITAFFSAYAKTVDSPTLDSEGQITSGNLRTSKIYAVLFAGGSALVDGVNSVPELQRLLARMLPDVLTADEESIEWLEERKSIEGVCRKLGLRFRGRGRPSKIPNQ